MQRRRPVRPSIAVLAIVAALVAGCGDSDGGGYGAREANEPAPTATATTPEAPPGATARECGETTVAGTEGLRVTGIGCDVGRGIVAAWAEKPACSRPADASRYSCTTYDEYRCLGAATDAGIAVSCARPGSSAAFLARRG
jgi:hypothetical protein